MAGRRFELHEAPQKTDPVEAGSKGREGYRPGIATLRNRPGPVGALMGEGKNSKNHINLPPPLFSKRGETPEGCVRAICEICVIRG